MWCPTCKAEVAAEVAADNRRVRCATCGGEIPVPANFGFAKTREARELLDRWASERQPDQPASRSAGGRAGAVRSLGGGVSLEAEPAGTPGRQDDPGSASRMETSAHDSQVSARRIDAAQTLSGPYVTAGSSTSRTGRSESARVHRIHGPEFNGPNFDIQGSLLDTDRRKTNWTYALGQLMAYAGVALLTVGCTLVLWGYFGGPASYAPTGWLTTMAGQMILILGVVTLVSGGMEQTNEDVRVRIERLGERIIRIEQIARDQALRGPNTPADFSRAQAPEIGQRQESEIRR
ncbi:MAG TPA: hypothetical protein VEI07_07985 [Planctomycetaceae bacterium]|nr:hypothetical protein [Planctomycetaceae bacterium]